MFDDHVHQFARDLSDLNVGVECKVCGLRLQDKTEAHAMAVKQQKDIEFLEALLDDPNRILTHLTNGRTIRNSRGEIVFEARGDLPRDRSELLEIICRQIRQLYKCALCEKEPPLPEHGLCVQCAVIAKNDLSSWQKVLHSTNNVEDIPGSDGTKREAPGLKGK